MSLKINNKVPAFKAKVLVLPNQEKDFSDKDLKGKWSVIYFYPKDMTPGCTVEACEFRDSYDFFPKHDINLFGVSTDSIKSHIKFLEKHQLPFQLVSDEEKSMVKAFDVYSEKSMFGKKYMGIVRTTYIVNPDGKIVFVWDKVKPLGHTKEVISFLAKATKD